MLIHFRPSKIRPISMRLAAPCIGALSVCLIAAPSGVFAAPHAPQLQAADATAAPTYGPAPPAPPIELSTPALEAATAFRDYERKAAQISPKFTTGTGVEDSLAIGSAYEPHELSRGAIAYAALVALQDPTFVHAFRVYAPYPDQARTLAARIVADPRYAAAFPGAASAAGLIVATMASEVGKLQTTGAAVKQSAYSVQHSAWSKSRVINPLARLSKTKALSTALMTPAPEDMQDLKLAEGGAADPRAAQAMPVHGQAVDGPYAPVVQRGLAVAALASMGVAGDSDAASVETLLNEPEDGACLNMSKLNLYQCLAVAGPWYEDIFCLGEHALGETAQCIVKETGTPSQIQAAVTPVSQAGGGAGGVAPVAAAAPGESKVVGR
jgi:hypothetical protein